MAKPIFLLGVHYTVSPATLVHVKQQLRDEMPDYHVIIYPTNKEEQQHTVLNAEDMEPLQFEELKSKIEGIINETA
jgi:hypothetical protein